MEILKKKIVEKSLKNTNHDTFEDKTQLINAISKLNIIFKRRNLSIKYIERIFSYFISFFEFLHIKKNKEKVIKKIVGNNDIIYYYISKINIEDIYDFVNLKYNNYKNSTKNAILSKMRKYSRLLNEDFELEYKNKPNFPRLSRNETIIEENLLVDIINNLKNNIDLENLIIFYFLYYSGITFSSIARILPNHFKNNFSLLKLKKGKEKKINIPKIISQNLILFNANRKNLSQYFFYEYYSGSKIIQRTEFIKYNFLQSITSSKVNYEIRNYLISLFSRTRKYKILNYTKYYLFEFNPLEIPKKIDESKNEKQNCEYSKENFSFNENIIDLSESENSYFISQNNLDYLEENNINQIFKNEECNKFFRKRIANNIRSYYLNQ